MMSEDTTVDTVETEETPEEKPAQTVEITDAGPARKALKITLPAERIKAAIEENYDKLKDDAAIPGFRRGRAPQRLIEKRFGTAVRDDVKGQLIAEAYEQAIETEGLKVLGQPDVKDIEDLKLPEDGPLEFSVEIEINPEFDLPSLEGIELNKPIAEVRDEDIEEELEKIKERYGKLEPIGDGAAEPKDYLEVEAFILAGENTELPANAKAPTEDEEDSDNPVIAHYPATYVLVHGEDKEYKGHVVGILIDDLGKQAAGKKTGDTINISMTGPTGHEDAKIKDQPITVNLKINGIQRMTTANIDAILEQTGVESEDDLRKELREGLEGNRDRNQRVNMHEQICDHLAEAVELELPEGLSGQQSARILQRQAMDLAYKGESQEEIEEKLAELRTNSEEEARKQLKLFFILEKASEQLEVEVDDQEVNGRVAMMAIQQGRRPEKLRQEMLRNGRLEQLYLSLRDETTMDLIIEKAKVTEVELPDDEDDAKPAPKKKSSKKKSSKKKAAKKKDDDASDDGDK